MTSHGEPGGPLSNRLLRRAFHTYWRFSRGLTIGVRGAVLDSDNRVLLIRHTYIGGWHMPGGGVETGETALDALTRELHEEAQVVMTGTPELHGVFFNRQTSPRDHVLVYVVREFRMDGIKQPDREIAEVGFFSTGQLPEGTSGATRRRLDEILHGEPRSPNW